LNYDSDRSINRIVFGFNELDLSLKIDSKEMRALTSVFVLSLVILLGSACSGVKVTSDKDSSVDFSKYKTFEYYGWAEESDKILNRFDKERIEKAFGNEFAKRGWKYVESGGDAVVSLFIVVDTKTQTNAYTEHYNSGPYGPRWGYGYGYGYGGMSTSTTTYSESEYKVGTLVVDVFDKADQKLIWQSVGNGTVDENPDKRERNIPKVAAMIMKPFPIPPMADGK